jgi:hypothetical protein
MFKVVEVTARDLTSGTSVRAEIRFEMGLHEDDVARQAQSLRGLRIQ